MADVKALNRVLVMFLPAPVFWTLYDQQGSSWVLQAEEMMSFSMVRLGAHFEVIYFYNLCIDRGNLVSSRPIRCKV